MRYDMLLERVKAHRKNHNLNQKEMAERLSMSDRTYQRFENGEKKKLDMDELKKFAEVLELDLAELLFPESVHIDAISDSATGIIGTLNNTMLGPDNDVTDHYKKIIDEKNLIIEQQQRIIEQQNRLLAE